MDILRSLNSDQKRAVTQTRGPVLVLAGAGSGKTRALTHRIAYLVETRKVSPHRILAVTFTNKAAEEMGKRVRRLLGGMRAIPLISTFHSLGVRILRREIKHLKREPNFSILDQQDQVSLVKRLMKDLGWSPQELNPGAVVAAISSAKSELIDASKYARSFVLTPFHKKVALLYQAYEKKLRADNFLDFGDLIMLPVKIFQTHPQVLSFYQDRYRYILVDEYQDTDKAQYQLTNLLAQKYYNLFVVGDDWQSIYSWRGANYRNVLEFKHDYPEAKVIKLEQNYRSSQNILDADFCVIKPSPNRSDKKLWTGKGKGEKLVVYEAFDERDEAEYVIREALKLKKEGANLNEMVVLYRTNAQSRILEETCLKHKLSYRIVGGLRFYERKEIKDLLAYLRLLQNPYDELSLIRIINVPPRGMGQKTLETLLRESVEKKVPVFLLLSKTEGRSAKSLHELYRILKELREQLSSKSLVLIFDSLLKRVRYLDYLDDGTVEGNSRVENVKELRTVIKKYARQKGFSALEDFLADVSLISDVDALKEKGEAITLMTLHSAKGLEYDFVFMVGLEENLLPHVHSFINEEELSEERRLCYVGLTRARKKVYLSYARARNALGTIQNNLPSRFIADISDDYLKYLGANPKILGSDAIWGSISQIPEEDLEVGDRVEHRNFGEGIVVQVSGDQVLVSFLACGLKKLVRGVAPLKKLS